MNSIVYSCRWNVSQTLAFAIDHAKADWFDIGLAESG